MLLVALSSAAGMGFGDNLSSSRMQSSCFCVSGPTLLWTEGFNKMKLPFKGRAQRLSLQVFKQSLIF